MENDCIVHARKSRSIFHQIVNQIRQTNQFHPSILQQLPKRCCSCDEKKEALLTFDRLYQLCREIQSLEKTTFKGKSRKKSESLKTIHHLILQSPDNYDYRQQMYKIGRFVGSGGKNFREIQQKLHISLHISNCNSSKDLRERTADVRGSIQSIPLGSVLVFFTINNKNNQPMNVRRLENLIRDEWNDIQICTTKQQLKYYDRELEEFGSSFLPEKDSRWTRKHK